MLYDLSDSEHAMTIYLATNDDTHDTLDIMELDEMIALGGLNVMWNLFDDAYDNVKTDNFDDAARRGHDCESEDLQVEAFKNVNDV